MQTVRWEQKSAKELTELFGSTERAEQIKKLDEKGKEFTIKKLKIQMEELAKYQEEIAHHYAYCTEILKRASDSQNIDTLILRLRKMALENREKWSEEIGIELAKRQELLEEEEEDDEEDEASSASESESGSTPSTPRSGSQQTTDDELDEEEIQENEGRRAYNYVTLCCSMSSHYLRIFLYAKDWCLTIS